LVSDLSDPDKTQTTHQKTPKKKHTSHKRECYNKKLRLRCGRRSRGADSLCLKHKGRYRIQPSLYLLDFEGGKFT